MAAGVALHRTLQDLFRTGMHHPLEVVTVDQIESQRHQCGPDGTDGLFEKGDMVRNAAHEREGLPVQVYNGNVCRAHDAFRQLPLPNAALIHRENVPASMDQRDTFQQFESLALPELDAAVRLPHPLRIVGVEMDGYTPCEIILVAFGRLCRH
jgi:hypothetical protein